ncbi:hypothetical protein GCM10023188_47400 [Pontibacter saemangeumensis]|uniref:Uncharacterized protein n=1 Tax=Pontibacter saemangeumensis TaxID=1084525 RepID=A0ABP8M7X5_9BACT
MNHELIVRYITDDEEEEPSSHWFYKRGINWLSLNEALKEAVLEVTFLDEKETLLNVFYGNRDGMELTAVVTTQGEVICKGLLEVTEHIERHNLFIVYFRGCYANGDLFYYYGLQETADYFMVIDLNGSVIVEPRESHIEYDEEEEAFYIGSSEEAIPVSELLEKESINFSW